MIIHKYNTKFVILHVIKLWTNGFSYRKGLQDISENRKKDVAEHGVLLLP